MTAKKVKIVKKKKKLTVEDLNVGDVIPTLHDKDMEITEELINQMKAFEQESKKSAIWRNKITGSFIYFKWIEEHPEEKKAKKSKKVEELDEEEESLDEEIEAEVQSEEDMMLDAMEDYKVKYHTKTVNPKSQKFKQFLYKWKQDSE